MELNKAARIKFREILGEGEQEDAIDYDDCLLERLEHAQEVFSLLKDKQEWEIVHLMRGTIEQTERSFGFDIGYWGGDHFSVICDCVVMPTWHPPDPRDFDELAKALERLNNHLLFRSVADAEIFKAWYISRSWAESETYEGQFCLIRVDQVHPRN
jgi:hypothetical protein